MTPPHIAPSPIPALHRFAGTDPLGLDAALLRSHVQHCGRASGGWSGVARGALALHGFFLPRFATTLSVMLAVVVAVTLAV